MSKPLSPPPETRSGQKELPAYVSNGVIGLRVRTMPLAAGMALLNGFAGRHHERQIEAAAVAPYPLAADLALDGVWLSDSPHSAANFEQSYDFSAGELTTSFTFSAAGAIARVEVLTFCSRPDPSLACQEVRIETDRPCTLTIRAMIDATGIAGRPLYHSRETPGEPEPAVDGSLLWESEGGFGTCGIAFSSELLGAGEQDPQRPPLVSAEAVAAAVRVYAEEANRQNQERRTQAEIDRRALEKMDRGIKSIMTAIEDGMYQPAMKVRMTELQHQKLEIEARLAQAPANVPDVHPNIAEIYRAKVSRLAEALASPEANGDTREDIRSLVGEVVITPGEGRGVTDAKLRGQLIGILDFVSDQRRSLRPEVITKGAAGPRNQRFLRKRRQALALTPFFVVAGKLPDFENTLVGPGDLASLYGAFGRCRAHYKILTDLETARFAQ